MTSRLLCWALIAVVGLLLGGAIGMLLDSIVQAISHQYIFPEGEFAETGARCGMILGMWLGLSCTLTSRPLPTARSILMGIVVCVACAGMVGAMAGGLGLLLGRHSPSEAELRSIVPLGRLWTSWGLTAGTLVGATVGTLLAMMLCFSARRATPVLQQDVLA